VALFDEIKGLSKGEMLEDDFGIIAYQSTRPPVFGSLPLFLNSKKCETPVKRINHPMDLVKTNAGKIESDINLIKGNLAPLPDDGKNQMFGSHQVLISEGVKVQACIFNTEDGSVFVGANALLMEGSIIRGPVAIGEGAVLKMGSQIYGGTTIGKKCTAGGEIKNSILGDFSNKAHHGYLGDSVVGQWCNLGAGTTNSNVKNNAGIISMWCGLSKEIISIGQKAGMVMGDFSKTAINTSINSGTTIGVGCSLHLSGYSGKVIPSFTWGISERYKPEKLVGDIESWMAFKQEKAGPELGTLLHHLYANHSDGYDENHG
jgi:UDP-N-acetylglucosamine diphosphorylase/glucosamine-1-phosphate N-acetyltransferase